MDVVVNPIALHACNPGPMTGDGNLTWLLAGRVPTLIDAGTGDARHMDSLSGALAGHALAQVLVTHAHVDHASGAPVIAARHPGARFMKLPWADRDHRWDVAWEALADGDRVPAGDATLQVVHTPGHAPDHVCFWHEESRTLFGGDLASRSISIYIPASRGGDLTAYLASLERVLALDPARIVPAHGPVIDHPRRLLRAYIAHRRDRERQVLDALRPAPATVEDVASRIYRRLDAAFLPAARETVLAHLLKLEREGRAAEASGAWHIMEP
ncbi:MAG: MBL fold metallo-hydrolase [Acidobacteria bacterium]|nr:MBL fold metallo-hydrolase [Acidobacteriota bacterium]